MLFRSPAWKARAIADITRRDVRELLEKIAERAPVMANRVLAVTRKMFNFAIDQELIEVNPAARVTRPGGVEQSRDRVLSDDEVRAFWTACEGLTPQMAAYYRLRLLTAQRGAEVGGMRWQDVDLSAGWWTISAAVAKNKRAHRVPLAPSVVQMVEALAPDVEKRDGFVLAGARGRRQQSEAATVFASIANFHGHDLRRTAASRMTGGGVPRLTVSRILNHVETGVTAVYDRHSYDAEKHAALDWWATRLASIIDSNADGAAVLPFARRA